MVQSYQVIVLGILSSTTKDIETYTYEYVSFYTTFQHSAHKIDSYLHTPSAPTQMTAIRAQNRPTEQ